LLLLEAAGLELTDEEATRGIGGARPDPGRLQAVTRTDGTWVLDVAHNVEALEAVLEALEATGAPRPRAAVASVLGDKPWRRMIRLLGRGRARRSRSPVRDGPRPGEPPPRRAPNR
ncbi:MAG: glutamate ligase domain-containing protein, partial [Gemmatimonadota bacterium]